VSSADALWTVTATGHDAQGIEHEEANFQAGLLFGCAPVITVIDEGYLAGLSHETGVYRESSPAVLAGGSWIYVTASVCRLLQWRDRRYAGAGHGRKPQPACHHAAAPRRELRGCPGPMEMASVPQVPQKIGYRLPWAHRMTRWRNVLAADRYF